VRIFEFIDRQKAEFPVKVLCAVCGVSRSGFYAWAGRGPGGRDVEEETLAREIEAIWEASRRSYGSPRVWRRLRRNGFRTSRKRVARIMAERGWRGRAGRRRVRTTIVDPAAAPAPDLVGRDFTATRPGEKLVGDITYVRTWEGWLYVATVIDLYSRRVVGWSIADHMRACLVGDALEAAPGCYPGGLQGAIFHSDRGSQGGFNWSSQHPDLGGVRGQASRVDEGVDGPVADEVAGRAGASPRGGTGVLAGNRDGGHDGGRGGSGRGGIRGRVPLVPAPWRHALDRCCPVVGSLSVFQ
jgi:hypothetical protein